MQRKYLAWALGALLATTSPAVAAEILFVSDSATDGVNIPAVLSADGHNVTVVTFDFGGGDNPTLRGPLSGYDAVYWSATGEGYGSVHSFPAVFSNLEAYVTAGGRVFVTGYDSISSPTDGPLKSFIGATGNLDGGAPGGPVISVVNSMTTGVVDIRGVTPTGGYGDQDTAYGLTVGTVGIVPSAFGTDRWMWTLRTLGAGAIAYVSNGAHISDSSGEYASWLDTSPGGAGAYNAVLRNFALGAGGVIDVPEPVDSFLAVRRVIRRERRGVPRFHALMAIDVGMAVPDWGTATTITLGALTLDIPGGLDETFPGSGRYRFRDGSTIVAVAPRRSSSHYHVLVYADDPSGQSGNGMITVGFENGDVGASSDVELEDGIFRAERGDLAVASPSLVVQRFRCARTAQWGDRIRMTFRIPRTGAALPMPTGPVLAAVGSFAQLIPRTEFVSTRRGFQYLDRSLRRGGSGGVRRLFVNDRLGVVNIDVVGVTAGPLPVADSPCLMAFGVGGDDHAVDVMTDVPRTGLMLY